MRASTYGGVRPKFWAMHALRDNTGTAVSRLLKWCRGWMSRETTFHTSEDDQVSVCLLFFGSDNMGTSVINLHMHLVQAMVSSVINLQMGQRLEVYASKNQNMLKNRLLPQSPPPTSSNSSRGCQGFLTRPTSLRMARCGRTDNCCAWSGDRKNLFCGSARTCGRWGILSKKSIFLLSQARIWEFRLWFSQIS
jgi:hypothetical protein